ncbi:MAG: hypothetical protein SNJ70_09375, partial [Armatimonadota bacterium]
MEKVVFEFKPQNTKATYIVEQGIPVFPIDTNMVDGLRLLDENNNLIPASIEHDGRDEHGNTVWVRISTQLSSNKTLTLDYKPELPKPGDKLKIKESPNSILVENTFYTIKTKNPGNITISTPKGDIINGDVNFQLWPDASSIVGGGAGTCRLAWFEPQDWTIEEQTDYRTLILLKGRVRKFRTVMPPEHEWHDDAQFDCELELICYSFSPVI